MQHSVETLAQSSERSAAVVVDVEAAFARLPRTGVPLAVWTAEAIPSPAYTTRLDNRLGFRNHFQSVVRAGSGNVLVLSGSDARQKRSSLFIAGVGEIDTGGPLGSNLGAARRPPATDVVLNRVDLDSILWHAGGLAVHGHVLAVPLYGADPIRGRVSFLDITDPLTPRPLAVSIERPGRKAYAVAMTVLADQHYLVAVLSARDGLGRRLDFYRSHSAALGDGFGEPVTWTADAVEAREGQDENFADFQNISLVRQADGRLFLIGLHNTAPSMEVLPGRDYADLYEVVLGADPARELAVPRITKIANHHLVCEDGYCNLDAAGGVHVDARGELVIYGAAFWVDGDRLQLTEFAAPDL